MSKFQLVAKTVEIITTSDGKEFANMADALAHQLLLDSAELIATPVEAYLNANQMFDRNRKQKQGVIEAFAAYLVSQGVDFSGVVAVERTVFDTPPAAKVVVEGEADAETEAAVEEAGAETVADAGAEDELF